MTTVLRQQVTKYPNVGLYSVCVTLSIVLVISSDLRLPQIDVQIANHHLLDHIEWDLFSPLSPEAFASKVALELGLTGEAIPLIAHAVHEELMKHKKDAVEWGVIGGERDADDGGAGDARTGRDRSGFGLVKDKTGLGSWGRAPRDGRGPKTLKSVWRDWADAEDFRTRFEVLTAEEVERREMERERASRYVLFILMICYPSISR